MFETAGRPCYGSAMAGALYCFGDSITHGGCDDEMGGWVNRLKVRFMRAGHGDHVFNFGIGGDTAADLQRRFEHEMAHRNAEAITLAVGANDVQCLGDESHPRFTADEYREHLVALVRRARRHARWVFVLGIGRIEADRCGRRPGKPVFLTDERVRLFDRLAREAADLTGAWFIPLNDVLQPDDLADGVHPNARGHERIAQRVYDSLAGSGFLEKA